MLRDWQQAALLAWINRCHGSVIAATGLGKSFLIVQAVITLKTPTVVLVPTLALADQWKRVFASAGIQAAIYSGEEKNVGWVTITLPQSIYEHPEVIREFAFVAVDEGDLLTADEWGRVLREGARHPFLLLVSATEPADQDRRVLLSQLAPVVYRITTAEGIRLGLLVPPEVIPVEVPLSPKEQEEYDDASDKVSKAVRSLGTSTPQEIARMTRSGNPNIVAAAFSFFKAVNMRKKVLQNTETKPEAVLRTIREHPGQRVFLFGSLVDPIERLCAFLNEHGVRCRTITGSTPTKVRRASLDEWGSTFEVLGLVSIGRRGLDIPAASIMVIVGSSSTESAIVQTLGRVLRPAPGKTSAHVYVVVSQGTIEERLLKRIEEVARGT